MLKDIHRRSLIDMNLGIRQHGALLAGKGDLIRKVFARDKHTCHMCGYRVPGWMEIDHVKAHRRDASLGDLKTICQFCHNLRHPFWAASRVRIIPIHAPDLSQADLHRLAWTLLAWRDVEDGPIDTGAVLSMIDERHATFMGKYGCGAADALLEAAAGLAGHRIFAGKQDAAVKILSRVDADLRFWPMELQPGAAQLDAGCRLSTWSIGGFHAFADQAAEAIRQDQSPDFEKIRSAAKIAFEKAREAA